MKHFLIGLLAMSGPLACNAQSSRSARLLEVALAGAGVEKRSGSGFFDSHVNLDPWRSPDFWIMQDAGRVWPQWLELIEQNPDRFVVGSDATQRSAAVDAERIASVEVLLSQLSPGTRERVARTNLESLLD